MTEPPLSYIDTGELFNRGDATRKHIRGRYMRGIDPSRVFLKSTPLKQEIFKDLRNTIGQLEIVNFSSIIRHGSPM